MTATQKAEDVIKDPLTTNAERANILAELSLTVSSSTDGALLATLSNTYAMLALVDAALAP